MLNIADEQQILLGYVDIISKFRKFAFDFRWSRCNIENVMELLTLQSVRYIYTTYNFQEMIL